MPTRDLTPEQHDDALALARALALGCDLRDAIIYVRTRRALLTAAQEMTIDANLQRATGIPGRHDVSMSARG